MSSVHPPRKAQSHHHHQPQHIADRETEHWLVILRRRCFFVSPIDRNIHRPVSSVLSPLEVGHTVFIHKAIKLDDHDTSWIGWTATFPKPISAGNERRPN